MGNEDPRLEQGKVGGEESLTGREAPSSGVCARSSSRRKVSLSASRPQRPMMMASCYRYSHQHLYQPEPAKDLFGVAKCPAIRQHSCETGELGIPWDCWILLRPRPMTISFLLVPALSGPVSFAWTWSMRMSVSEERVLQAVPVIPEVLGPGLGIVTPPCQTRWDFPHGCLVRFLHQKSKMSR